MFSQYSSKHFLRSRKEISFVLYRLYNEVIFSSLLPNRLPLVWSPRLRTSAGFFKYSFSNGEIRNPRIELSTKVLDSYVKLKSTLCHELCHAAVVLIDHKMDGAPHGDEWKKWANVAMKKDR